MKAYLKRKVFWLKDLFKGGRLLKAYKYVANINSKFPEFNNPYNEIVEFAVNNVEFYKQYKNISFENLPVINKLMIIILIRKI